SRPGEGATFTVYLPRIDAPVERGASGAGRLPEAGGNETILVVEDEHELRRLVCQTLELHGYRTLEAAIPEEALRHCERHGAAIRLVVTDVVMPQMSGPELFRRLEDRQPAMKVLFMSGYLTERQDHRDIFDNNHHFLQKPFSTSQLVQMVREVLDAPPAGTDA
ncbi:MAG: response regulator, partial [Myxococcales bacterium]|nr:response regulator [Myxococcales bacterium]